MGTLTRWLKNLTAADADTETAELRESAQSAGCVDMCGCTLGQRARLLGIIRSVTTEPASALPRLEAVVSDGTGSARLVWLGRRRIVGIEPGRRVRIDGRVAARREDSERAEIVLYNPRYELLPMDSV